jgi:hypothetical protein
MALGQGGGFGGNSQEQPEGALPVATVYLSAPVSARAAATWIKLQEPIKMDYVNETNFEQVLKDIKEATKGKDGKGLRFYVDPVGLQEAEKTMSSPVTLQVEDVPLATSLTLLLKQLGMIYYVQADGLVMIVSEHNDEHLAEPSKRILEELAALRQEVTALRGDLNLVRRPR